jgi:hypothetical protein
VVVVEEESLLGLPDILLTETSTDVMTSAAVDWTGVVKLDISPAVTPPS